MQERAKLEEAVRLLARPYAQLYRAYAQAMRHPREQLARWPARALEFWSATFRDQYDAYSALADARSAERAAQRAVLCIDAYSEAAGPIAIEPLFALAKDARLAHSPLVGPAGGAIPDTCVLVTVSGGRLLFALVGLRGATPSPLALGRYSGALRLESGELIARLHVDVVPSVAG